MRRNKLLAGAIVSTAIIGAATTPVFAGHCYVPDKPTEAGMQLLLGPDFEPSWVSNGVAQRIERGVIDPETGEGFHGIIGFDFDGDGEADVSTWQITPEGSVPDSALENGSPDHGMNYLPFEE